MVKKLNKFFILSFSIFISFFSLITGVFSQNASAINTASTSSSVQFRLNQSANWVNMPCEVYNRTCLITVPSHTIYDRMRINFPNLSNIKSGQKFVLSFAVYFNSYVDTSRVFWGNPFADVAGDAVIYSTDNTVETYSRVIWDNSFQSIFPGDVYKIYYYTVYGYITDDNFPGYITLAGNVISNYFSDVDFYFVQPYIQFYDDLPSPETNAIKEQTEQQQEHYEEQQEQAEQQGQDAQDNSDETQSQVDSKTQNLFSFITSFFGAFTSASPSNCNFDWGLADKGFGVINMCQTSIPPELQSILSIVSILIVVPMVLWLINSIVGAFKEFQQ